MRVYKPEMKIKDYEAYRGIYCSLCRSLGKNYGLFARLTLNFDVTLLAVMRIALSDTCPSFKGGRCPFNLTKRCNYCTDKAEQLDYAAAVGVLLVYFKLLDDLRDEGFFGKLKAGFLYLFMLRAAKKAKKRYPHLAELIGEAMSLQQQTEKNGCASVDEAAEPTASALGKLFAYHIEDSINKRAMERFGYCLGRFIYILDAADDIEKDIKRKSYNVFIQKSSPEPMTEEKIKAIKKEAEGMLNLSCGEAVKAYELCSLTSLKAVCDNILYEGLYHSAKEKLTTDNKTEKRNEKSI